MRGMMGRGKGGCLSLVPPLPIVPRALSFSLSPTSLRYKEASTEKNALIQKEHTCSSISTIRLNSKILGAGILRARRGSLLSPLPVLLERPVK